MPLPSKSCRDIHIRFTEKGNMLIDFRDSNGSITDIHEYETTDGVSRSGVNTIIEALMGGDYRVRKIK